MFSTAPGAGEAQRAATWHMRGASSGWAAGDWAAADLRAFSVQLTGFRLTLCCQEAHLLGRLWPGHDHSPSGPWQLSLMHTWSAGGDSESWSKGSELPPETSSCPHRSGVGPAWAGQRSCPATLPQPGPAPSPAPATSRRAEAPWPPSTIHCCGAGSPKEGPTEQEEGIIRDPSN